MTTSVPRTPVPRFERDGHTVQWIKLKFLHKDRTVQRPFDQKHCDKIAADFDPDKFNSLHATADNDGENFSVFAHQHSMEAARKVLGDEQRVPVIVHDDLSVQRKAEIWLGLDEGRRPNVLDKWRIRILARETNPIKIEHILGSYNLKISDQKGDGHVRAVSALESLYIKSGESGLRWVIDVISETWGRDRPAYDAVLIAGLGELYRLLGAAQKHLGADTLARKIATNSGPAKLIGQARDLAKIQNIRVSLAMAQKIMNVYNKGRQDSQRIVLKFA